jgi:hypothetical protein
MKALTSIACCCFNFDLGAAIAKVVRAQWNSEQMHIEKSLPMIDSVVHGTNKNLQMAQGTWCKVEAKIILSQQST